MTSTSGYSATDDNFVSQPLFFFPHPTKGSGKLVKSYPGEYDPYDSRGYYGLDVLSNDPLGLTAKQLDKIGWDTLGVAKWPSRGALGQPRSDGHDNFAHGRYLYYMPTRAGLDTFAYEKGSKIAGVVCTGTVTVRNVAVQNVEVRAVYKGIVVYNPNPFKVTVEITGSWDPSGVQKMASVKAGGSYTYRPTEYNDTYKEDRKFYVRTTLDRTEIWGTNNGYIQGGTFITKSLAPNAVHVRTRGNARSLNLYLTNTTSRTATYRVTYKKAGKAYQTVTVKVKAKKAGKAYKTLLRKTLKSES